MDDINNDDICLYCNIGDSGAIAIGEALKVNSTLTKLWLWRT